MTTHAMVAGSQAEGGERCNGGDARVPRFAASADASSSSSSTMAERANALEVYEDAVQEPFLECSNLASMYYRAQEIGSMRPDAKVLREDFCSSAIVAQTWLGMEKDNRAQGVDIDLAALKVARKRCLAAERANRTAVIIQAGAYSPSGQSSKLTLDDVNPTTAESATGNASTWAKGAASDRFERKFQARLAKEAKARGKDIEQGDWLSDALVLQHADVLSLPLSDVKVEAPDLVYAGNYALSYFHDRTSLLAYLRQCRRTLRKRTGVLIVDPFAGPTSWDAITPAEREEQERRWSKFGQEPGFLREGEEKRPPRPLLGDLLEFWTPPPSSESDSAHWQHWPRGRLVLVRRGLVGGGYEYWREDGPMDYATNRFRMSLSFRFADGSWLRDYFSYDFRVWSVREITEAMEEVGFESVSVHAIPRTQAAKEEEEEERSEKHRDGKRERADSSASATSLDSTGLGGMAALMEHTEQHEAQKSTYKELEPGQKLFATQSFGTYIVARVPSVGS